MAKFETVHGMFKYLKKEGFMLDYAKMNPKGGFNHRFCGTYNGGKAELNKEDLEAISVGLDEFIDDCLQIKRQLKEELKN